MNEPEASGHPRYIQPHALWILIYDTIFRDYMMAYMDGSKVVTPTSFYRHWASSDGVSDSGIITASDIRRQNYVELLKIVLKSEELFYKGKKFLVHRWSSKIYIFRRYFWIDRDPDPNP